jgi:glycine cleavage system H protein
MVKQGLFYTKEHEWIKVDGNVGTVGVSDHAQSSLGELTFVELPDEGQDVSAGGEMAVLESSKAASDVYAPMAGKVAEVNGSLEGEPDLINKDCYGDGWIAKIELSDPGSTGELMDAAAYEKFLAESE